MKEKITLIIPTHNRHYYLDRILDYYHDFNITKLIADSSVKEYYNKNKFDIEYFHYSDFAPSEKIKDIIKKVKTPYVFMCADDDFIIPRAIERCVEFLENNKDYSSAQGKYVRFYNSSKNISFEPLYSLYNTYIIDGNSPQERMKQLMSSYIPVFYSVQRIENLHQAFLLKNLTNLYLLETYFALITVINGKHKVFPFYYSAREKTMYKNKREDENIEVFIENPDNKEEFELFLNILTEYISKKYNYKIDDSKKYIQEAIDSYLKIFLPRYKKKKETTYTPSEKIKNIIFSILEIISPKFYNVIKNKTIYGNFENPSSKFYVDFKQIRKIISTHSRSIQILNKTPKRIFRKLDNLNKVIHIPFFNKIFKGFLEEL